MDGGRGSTPDSRFAGSGASNNEMCPGVPARPRVAAVWPSPPFEGAHWATAGGRWPLPRPPPFPLPFQANFQSRSVSSLLLSSSFPLVSSPFLHLFTLSHTQPTLLKTPARETRHNNVDQTGSAHLGGAHRGARHTEGIPHVCLCILRWYLLRIVSALHQAALSSRAARPASPPPA